MKRIRIIGLGIAIWGSSLLWPEINRLLTPGVMIGFGFGLGITILVYDFRRQFRKLPQKNDMDSSRPVPPILLAG